MMTKLILPGAYAGADLMWMRFHHDDGTRITKSASAQITRDIINQHKPDKDHFLIHCSAMGAFEKYGQNRNGDAFTRDVLKRTHPTFVKNAHFFRHHNNKDPKFKIGDVVYSAYNDDMDRVELLIHGHKKLAAEEYEMVKAGEELAVSMACKVPNDRCSICDNLAKNPLQYCSHFKETPNKYLPHHEKYAFVFNDNPRFFDISRVYRPADRIAFHLGYDADGEFIQKAASDGGPGLFVPAYVAAQAFGMDGSEDVIKEAGLEDSLHRLVEAEQRLDYRDDEAEKVATLLIPYAFGQDLDQEDLDILARREPYEVFGPLTKRACFLSFPDFSSMITGTPKRELMADSGFKEVLEKLLPGIFRSILNTGCSCKSELLDELQLSSGHTSVDSVVDKIINKADERFGCNKTSLEPRVIRIALSVKPKSTLRSGALIIKRASERQEIQKNKFMCLADAYALYKLAAYKELRGQEINNLEFLVAGQNRIK